MNYLLKADKLTVIRGGKNIVDAVSLTVAPDDFITVIGPNGAGKSTLVRSLLGLEKYQSGEITKNESVTIAYIPQDHRVNRAVPLRVIDFITLGRKISDIPEIDEVIEICGLGLLLETSLQDLSGGERRRSQLCRAMLQKPNLLVLDEPTIHLDIANQGKLYQIIGNYFQRQHCSVIMVSHDLSWVMAESKTVICMNHHICCHGTAESVANDNEFIGLYGSEYAKSFARYRHRHNT